MAATFDNETHGSVTAATSIVVTTPTCAAGDRLVVGIGFTGATPGTPTGWILLPWPAGPAIGANYYTRKATGTEAATYTWTWAGAADAGYVAGCWKNSTYPDDGWDNIDFSARVGGANGGAAGSGAGSVSWGIFVTVALAYSQDLLNIVLGAHWENNSTTPGHLGLQYLTERSFVNYGTGTTRFGLSLLEEDESPYYMEKMVQASYTPGASNLSLVQLSRNYEATTGPPRPKGDTAWGWTAGQDSGWGMVG